MKIITAHSFRGGTGKTNILANLSYALAITGKRVGIIDADATHPSLHIIFGQGNIHFPYTFGEFLLNECKMDDIIYDISPKLNLRDSVYLIPSKLDDKVINKILRLNQNTYNLERVFDALISIGEKYCLDYLLIDTKPELDERVLLYILNSNLVLIVTRHDEADIKGTAELLKRICSIPQTKLFVIPSMLRENEVQSNLDQLKNEFKEFKKKQVKISDPILYSSLLWETHAPRIDQLFIVKYPEDIFSKSIFSLASNVDKMISQ